MSEIQWYTLEAQDKRGMTLDELFQHIQRAKAVGVAGDSVVNVENFVRFDMAAKGMPLKKIHFVMPKFSPPVPPFPHPYPSTHPNPHPHQYPN